MHRTSHVLLSWALLAPVLFMVGCSPPVESPKPSRGARVSLSGMLEDAVVAESTDPLDAEAYLGVIDEALIQRTNQWALGAVSAALDALVWREVDDLTGVDHAIVHRSYDVLVKVSARLRQAWASGQGGPLQRGLIGDALHDLALRVGAMKAAKKWRRRAGCVPAAAVAGPVAWPALLSLDAPSPVSAKGPLPASFPGLAPFDAKVRFETVFADACAIDVNEVGTLPGLRLVVVDIDNPRTQTLSFALTSSSAAKLELGGKPLLERPFAAGGGWITRYARAKVGEGRVRLVARVAQNDDGSRIAIQAWGEGSEPLSMAPPQGGDRASAEVLVGAPVQVTPANLRKRDLLPAAVALLSVGEARAAAELFAGELAPSPADASAQLDLLRIRALKAAQLLPRNQLLMQVQPAADRALERCSNCWEAKIYAAVAAQERKGYGTGIYARFEKLGVSAMSSEWAEQLNAMELLFIALGASNSGLDDIARASYDALSRRFGGSLMLADLDWRLHGRIGGDLIEAACEGGTSRSSTRCMNAHIGRSDLKAAFAEMERLRQLRGSPAMMRDLEISLLLSRGDNARALRIYDALPRSRRELAVLGVLFGGPQQQEAERRFSEDFMHAKDVPYGYEPLGRLLGVVDDRSFELEREGAKLVQRDRAKAFLPGAGTAVLRRLEHYKLSDTGLLQYWLYDLRRVSGTVDVASGTWMGAPSVEGRQARRLLRRRIYKKDGRVLDPDPTAHGAQGHTDLSQLQTGDYVEAILIGWALPQDNGQLVVDTPDVLPPRTSVREGVITFRRPKRIPLSLWSHSILGNGKQRAEGDDIVSEWRLTNQRPRRLESGVPPLEARAAISFGSDSWERIARSLGARYRSLDENDRYMERWVADALGDGDALPMRKKIARIVAAVGKAVRQGEPGALSDMAASWGGGSQRETARWILEQGTGSRTWVVHRAMRQLGLSSEIVVAETRPFAGAVNFPPHTGRFVHPLVRVTVDGQQLWIDADVSGPPLPPGRVSPELRGRQALLASGKMVAVDAEDARDVDEIDIRLVLAENGDASGTFTILLHGRPAQRLARAFETVVGSHRARMLRNVVLAWLPWADVGEVKLSSEEGAWQLALRAQITIVGLARPESRDNPLYSIPGISPVHAVFPRPAAITLGARYVAQAGRKAALAIDQPLLYHVRRRIELPASAKIEHMARTLVVEAPYAKATRQARRDGNAIVEDFRLDMPVGTVSPLDFDKFASDARKIDDGFMYGTRVTLAAKP